jgi:hypothetical protein
MFAFLREIHINQSICVKNNRIVGDYDVGNGGRSASSTWRFLPFSMKFKNATDESRDVQDVRKSKFLTLAGHDESRR